MTQEETSKLKFEEIKKAFKECNYYEPHFYRDAFDFYLLYDKISEVGVRVYFLTEGLFIDTTDNFIHMIVFLWLRITKLIIVNPHIIF